MSRRAVLLVVTVGVGVSTLGAWRVAAGREAERREAVETSRARSWARSEAGAGISTVPKRVTVASERTLRRFREIPGYAEFAKRCASCHALPDPTTYAPRRWSTVMERMRHHVDRSGTMPPPESELDAALDFLRTVAEQPTRN